jgi:hypothetical protein
MLLNGPEVFPKEPPPVIVEWVYSLNWYGVSIYRQPSNRPLENGAFTIVDIGEAVNHELLGQFGRSVTHGTLDNNKRILRGILEEFEGFGLIQ